MSEDAANLVKTGGRQERSGLPTCLVRLYAVSSHAAVRAAAACLILGVLGGWAILNWSLESIEPDRSVALSDAEESFTIELAGSGARIVPGTAIRTDRDEMRELVLNGSHHMTVKGGARLAIEPLVRSGRTGCLVRLDMGEIYVHVEHDGNPFEVQTAQARAVITGTTFDVRATQAGTTLSVAEGSVRFEADGGAVQIVAGQQSMIAVPSGSPTTPVGCDVTALTAWARGDSSRTRQVEEISADALRLDDEMQTTLWPGPEIRTDLDDFRYTEWVVRHRDWFKRQFPWVFDLQDALDREGVDVDYATLLLLSGDVWRFAYPQTDMGRQVEPDWDALVTIASHYGHDEQWLRGQTLLSAWRINRERCAADLTPFAHWTDTIKAQVGARATAVIVDSMDACAYLVHTRTLAALAVREGLLTRLADSEKDDVLSLLESQMEALTECKRLLQQLLAIEPEASCRYAEEVGKVIQKITEIGELEKRIAACAKTIRL